MQTSSLHPRPRWGQYAAFPGMRLSLLIWSSENRVQIFVPTLDPSAGDMLRCLVGGEATRSSGSRSSPAPPPPGVGSRSAEPAAAEAEAPAAPAAAGWYTCGDGDAAAHF